MFKVVVAALGLTVAAGAAGASTVRIDVTGAYESATVHDWIRQGSYSFGTRVFYVDEVAFDWFAYAGEMRAGTGSALHDGTGFSMCEGLLWALCALPGQAGAMTAGEASVEDYAFRARVTDSALFYSTDAAFSWSEGGVANYANGLTATGRIDSFTMSEVPLPASGVLLLAGLGGAFAWGRRRKA